MSNESRVQGRGRMLLAAATLSTGMLMMVEGCAPHVAGVPGVQGVMGQVLANTPVPKHVVAATGEVEAKPAAKAPEAPKPVVAAKPVAFVKPMLAASCIKIVRKRVGNGKGASYIEQKVDTCKNKPVAPAKEIAS